MSAARGPWSVLLVHSNEDVAETTVDSLEAAKEWGRVEDAQRCTGRPSVFDSDFVVEQPDYVQFGTGYHYYWVASARGAAPGQPNAAASTSA